MFTTNYIVTRGKIKIKKILVIMCLCGIGMVIRDKIKIEKILVIICAFVELGRIIR